MLQICIYIYITILIYVLDKFEEVGYKSPKLNGSKLKKALAYNEKNF